MPRPTPIVTCSSETRQALERLPSSRSEEARLVERAKIILGCLEGKAVKTVAQELAISSHAVIQWRRRFESDGVAGLHDRPRSGRPEKHGEQLRERVLALLEEPPPEGQATWDGPSVAKALGVNAHAVWRVLREEGIRLSRQRR